jgi:hypothetical protein
MKSKIKIGLLFVALALMAAGCPEESEELLNPTSFRESVRIRFINFSDSENRNLGFDSEVKSGDVAWGNSSVSFIPPDDSAFVELFKGNQLRYSQERIFFFSRELNYTFISMPYVGGSDREKSSNLDSLMYFTDSSLLPKNSNDGFVKVANANSDTSVAYSVVLGCPAGELFTLFELSYSQFTNSRTILSGGNINISIIKTIKREGDVSEKKIVGTYNIDRIDSPENGEGQYTIIIAHDGTKERIYWLNERDFSANALQEIFIAPENKSNFRTINLSKSEVSLGVNGNDLENNLSSFYISDYKEIISCQSSESETFTLVSPNSGTMSGLDFYYAPELEKNYSALISTSLNTGLDTILFYPPVSRNVINSLRDDEAIIRVVNASEQTRGLQISLGANTSSVDPSDPQQVARNYSSGFSIASSLGYLSISSAVKIKSGIKPVNVFTSTQPGIYKSSFLVNLEAGLSYLLISYLDENGGEQFVLIKDSDEAVQLENIEEAVMCGLVNAFSYEKQINLNLSLSTGDDLIENANLYYENSISTIVSEGNNSVLVDNENYSFEAIVSKRNLLVYSGNENNKELLSLSYEPINAGVSEYIWRFLNGSESGGKIKIRFSDGEIDDGGDVIFYDIDGLELLEFGQFSQPLSRSSEKKISFQILDAGSGDELYLSGDFELPFGKGFTMIFAGRDGDYTLISFQEF